MDRHTENFDQCAICCLHFCINGYQLERCFNWLRLLLFYFKFSVDVTYVYMLPKCNSIQDAHFLFNKNLIKCVNMFNLDIVIT